MVLSSETYQNIYNAYSLYVRARKKERKKERIHQKKKKQERKKLE